MKVDRSKEIKQRLAGLSARSAVNILHYCFNKSDEVIKWAGKHISPTELLQQHPTFGDIPAISIPIRFFGGPPGNYNFYDGTLYTLVADAVLWAVSHQHDAEIDKFLNG